MSKTPETTVRRNLATDVGIAWEVSDKTQQSTLDRFAIALDALHIAPQRLTEAQWDKMTDRLFEAECDGHSPLTLGLLVVDMLASEGLLFLG